MSKSNSEAFNKLVLLANENKCIQIDKKFGIYEVTVWSNLNKLDHHHYQGDTLVEAVMKIK